MKNILLIFALLLATGAPPQATGNSDPDYEHTLLQTLRSMQRGERQRALAGAQHLSRQFPRSRLAKLLLGDLEKAQSRPSGNGDLLASLGPLQQDLRFEIDQRLAHQHSPARKGFYPRDILFAAEDQPFVILADQQSSRLYVYRNRQGDLELVADYFITIGLNGIGKQKRGDKRTPVGVYQVTRYIDGRELPDLYGAGAFPIDYPNAWDRRRRRSGDGIWIHGTPSHTYNRAPLASDGCIVVSNPDFADLEDYITPGLATPVVVAKRVEWISRDRWLRERQRVMRLLSAWIVDWQSLDHERYRSHYSATELDAYGRDFDEWDAHKRRVSRQKTWIEVDYRKLNVFNYPGEDDLLLMQFVQGYSSNNFNVESSKELYWRNRDGRWQIVYEGGRSPPSAAARAAVN